MFKSVYCSLFNFLQKLTIGLFALFTAFNSSAQNVEPVSCIDGVPLTGAYEDVYVDDSHCVLDGAMVYGSVLINGGSVSTTANGITILGGIQAFDAGDIQLYAAHVVDEVTLIQSSSLVVEGDSSLARIMMKESGDLTLAAGSSSDEVLFELSGNININGTVAAIHSTKSGGIRLDNAQVFPGGVSMSLSQQPLVVCGSTIGGVTAAQTDGSGGINVLEGGAVLAVAQGECGASQVEGTIMIQKGVGDVRFIGTTLQSDLIVIEQTGNVEFSGSSCAVGDASCGIVSDINVQKLTGNVSLKSITTDSDTTIAFVNGSVTIDSSTLGSDVKVHFNKDVTITNNTFSLEDVMITSNAGPVVYDRNCDARPTFTENNDLVISNNNAVDAAEAGATCVSGYGFSDADVSKNTGGVLIENNSGEGLYCKDNTPAPVQGPIGNRITFSDGQCVGF